MTSRRLTPALATAVAALLISACAAPGPAEHAPGYPRAIENCGRTVTFDRPPERVLVLETAPITVLDGIGALDAVVALAGSFDPTYYTPDLVDRLAAIPLLSDDLDPSGHLMLSQEVVLAQRPDLVLGLPDGLSRDALEAAGVNVLIQDIYCPEPGAKASLDDIYLQVRTYGTIFGRESAAEALATDLAERAATVRRQVAPGPSFAVLYPSVGGGPLYAYGSGSMATPQVEAAGLRNVFADVDERVFEVGAEELLARDPDVLILLGQGGDLSGLADEILALAGADSLRAVRAGEILIQPFNFSEPTSPLVIDGLERIVERFGAQP